MRYMLLSYLVILLFISCQQASNVNQVSYSYTKPERLTIPTLFTKEGITINNGIQFSKDGRTLYISNPTRDTFTNGKSKMGIFKYQYKNENWVGPEQIEFDLIVDAYHPVLSIENDLLFFNSRSKPDSVDIAIPHNIWFSKKVNQRWSEPELVKGINSSNYDSYPSVARNGNLYFNSDRTGGKGGMDIYVSFFVNGKYQKPLNIEIINSKDVENDLVIDPDERFIIFNRYFEATNEIDLFISFKEGHLWRSPQRLDAVNTPEKWELTPTLSPDGQYFFYELDGKIMQVDLASLLEKLE